MKVELTEKEANILMTLLDLVVKAKGLDVAAPALHFYNLFNRAYHEEQRLKEEAKNKECEHGKAMANG